MAWEMGGVQWENYSSQFPDATAMNQTNSSLWWSEQEACMIQREDFLSDLLETLISADLVS